ncbi:MAG: helix-turn-helix domain-containing protein [Candidatus Nanopelagicales bacterium]|nr:helix-turn-helix domain-containing protein [Candidatus Nanopelagicales bacterium]
MAVPDPTIFSRRMLTVREVADLLGVHVGTVYRMAEEGLFESLRVGASGRGVRIPSASLASYLARHTRGGGRSRMRSTG